jgi:hypothetical protein
MRLGLASLVLLAFGPLPLMAQEPQGAPPPTSQRVEAGSGVHELLPGIGRIGAEVGIFGGLSSNPYEVGRGYELGGYIDLPLARAPGGKLSYEILMSLSHGLSDPFTITNPLAYVANLAAGADREAALAGPPRAPFPVRRQVRTRLRVLEVSPFAFKYTVTRFDGARIRPYFAAGIDFAVVISRQDPVGDESSQFTGTAPFDDPLIGGIVAQAPELTARGLPTGQGHVAPGFHAQGGVEVRVSKGVSLNADYRVAGIDGTRARLQSLTGALGFHW